MRAASHRLSGGTHNLAASMRAQIRHWKARDARQQACTCIPVAEQHTLTQGWGVDAENVEQLVRGRRCWWAGGG